MSLGTIGLQLPREMQRPSNAVLCCALLDSFPLSSPGAAGPESERSIPAHRFSFLPCHACRDQPPSGAGLIFRLTLQCPQQGWGAKWWQGWRPQPCCLRKYFIGPEKRLFSGTCFVSWFLKQWLHPGKRRFLSPSSTCVGPDSLLSPDNFPHCKWLLFSGSDTTKTFNRIPIWSNMEGKKNLLSQMYFFPWVKYTQTAL